MTIYELLTAVRSLPDTVSFSQVMAVIEAHYHFSPTAFQNGALENEAGKNEGSCRLFAFGLLHGLSEKEMLSCFGDYYRKDVLQNPDGSDHQNIRQFMKSGWQGIRFPQPALTPRSG